MEYQQIRIKDKFNLFVEQWSPKIIAQMNNYHFKIAKIQGEFDWHQHSETDETFIVISGNMEILFRDGSVKLTEGGMYVVPKELSHKPVAEEECWILLIEPSGTINTGDTVTEKTHLERDWI